MELRDLIVGGIAGLLVLVLFFDILRGMLTKNAKGAWDAHTGTVGKLRARGFVYRREQPDLNRYLFGKGVFAGCLFPGKNLSARECVRKKDIPEWRSALTDVGETAYLIFTLAIPQAGDGSEAELPEMLFVPVSDTEGKWKPAAGALLAGEKLLGGRFGQWLGTLRGVSGVHTVGEHLTLIIPGQVFDKDYDALLLRAEEAAVAALPAIPKELRNGQ